MTIRKPYKPSGSSLGWPAGLCQCLPPMQISLLSAGNYYNAVCARNADGIVAIWSYNPVYDSTGISIPSTLGPRWQADGYTTCGTAVGTAGLMWMGSYIGTVPNPGTTARMKSVGDCVYLYAPLENLGNYSDGNSIFLENKAEAVQDGGRTLVIRQSLWVYIIFDGQITDTPIDPYLSLPSSSNQTSTNKYCISRVQTIGGNQLLYEGISIAKNLQLMCVSLSAEVCVCSTPQEWLVFDAGSQVYRFPKYTEAIAAPTLYGNTALLRQATNLGTYFYSGNYVNSDEIPAFSALQRIRSPLTIENGRFRHSFPTNTTIGYLFLQNSILYEGIVLLEGGYDISSNIVESTNFQRGGNWITCRGDIIHFYKGIKQVQIRDVFNQKYVCGKYLFVKTNETLEINGIEHVGYWECYFSGQSGNKFKSLQTVSTTNIAVKPMEGAGDFCWLIGEWINTDGSIESGGFLLYQGEIIKKTTNIVLLAEIASSPDVVVIIESNLIEPYQPANSQGTPAYFECTVTTYRSGVASDTFLATLQITYANCGIILYQDTLYIIDVNANLTHVLYNGIWNSYRGSGVTAGSIVDGTYRTVLERGTVLAAGENISGISVGTGVDRNQPYAYSILKTDYTLPSSLGFNGIKLFDLTGTSSVSIVTSQNYASAIWTESGTLVRRAIAFYKEQEIIEVGQLITGATPYSLSVKGDFLLYSVQRRVGITYQYVYFLYKGGVLVYQGNVPPEIYNNYFYAPTNGSNEIWKYRGSERTDRIALANSNNPLQYGVKVNSRWVIISTGSQTIVDYDGITVYVADNSQEAARIYSTDYVQYVVITPPSTSSPISKLLICGEIIDVSSTSYELYNEYLIIPARNPAQQTVGKIYHITENGLYQLFDNITFINTQGNAPIIRTQAGDYKAILEGGEIQDLTFFSNQDNSATSGSFYAIYRSPYSFDFYVGGDLIGTGEPPTGNYAAARCYSITSNGPSKLCTAVLEWRTQVGYTYLAYQFFNKQPINWNKQSDDNRIAFSTIRGDYIISPVYAGLRDIYYGLTFIRTLEPEVTPIAQDPQPEEVLILREGGEIKILYSGEERAIIGTDRAIPDGYTTFLSELLILGNEDVPRVFRTEYVIYRQVYRNSSAYIHRYVISHLGSIIASGLTNEYSNTNYGPIYFSSGNFCTLIQPTSKFVVIFLDGIKIYDGNYIEYGIESVKDLDSTDPQINPITIGFIQIADSSVYVFTESTGLKKYNSRFKEQSIQ